MVTQPLDQSSLEMQLSSTDTAVQQHREGHKDNGEMLRDAIIGFADGLTVPFALTAGLSAAGSTHIVIIGGVAELLAGAISMGLGAWLAAKTEAKRYAVEEDRERREVKECPGAEEEEIYQIFAQYGVARPNVLPILECLKRDEDMWVKFMMDFELKLEKPDSSRAWISGLIMGFTYLFGGLLPIIPYFAYKNVNHALFTSIGITFVLLVAFGYFRAVLTGVNRAGIVSGIVQTLLVGTIAAGTSYGIVLGVNKALTK